MAASFRLKVRLWGQNNRNLNNFGVIVTIAVVIGRSALCIKRNVNTKFHLHERLINRIKQFVAMVTDLQSQQN